MDTLTQLRQGRLAGATRLDLSCELTEFPREVFDLADTLEVLNLTGNRLSALPDDLGRLRKLRILFCSSNRFDRLPAVLGECEALAMVGFKSNRIERVDEAAFPRPLRWLILTDNRIGALPSSLGRCTALQKLMLAGNALESLPESMAACEQLELVRLAANQFRSLPEWLPRLPRLSWLALAGNPCAPVPDSARGSIAEIAWERLELREKLGEGASGVIHGARWKDSAKPVAVKVFKGGMTSDGWPESEMAAGLAAGAHPNLIGVLGRVAGHPAGAAGLVMERIDAQYASLAGPPDLDSCTRDIYDPERRFELARVRRIARGVAAAARRLHEQGILHGDLYAHNVLVNSEGHCLLGDFGAASFHPPGSRDALERIEVRAFGCLMEELLGRALLGFGDDAAAEGLAALMRRCLSFEVDQRPLFGDVVAELEKLPCD